MSTMWIFLSSSSSVKSHFWKKKIFRKHQDHCWTLITLWLIVTYSFRPELTRNRVWVSMVTWGPSRGYDFRCTQVRQVSKDDWMGKFFWTIPFLNQKVLRLRVVTMCLRANAETVCAISLFIDSLFTLQKCAFLFPIAPSSICSFKHLPIKNERSWRNNLTWSAVHSFLWKRQRNRLLLVCCCRNLS